MFLIRKNSSFLLNYLVSKSKISTLFSSSQFRIPLSLFASKVKDPPPKSFSIVNYLIDSVGLSPEEAIKASKSVIHIKSPSHPDSVLQFFKQNGLTDSNIKRIILHHSRILCANVDSTLKPKIEGLSKLGFSETQIAKLVTANPFNLNYLSYCNVLPRVEFLRGVLGSDENVVKAFSNDISLLSCNLEKMIKPNLSFLRKCRLSDARIGSLMMKVRQLMGRPLSYLEAVANRVEELGIPRGSKMFYQAFRFFIANNSDVVKTKIKFLGKLGFSEAEILSAIQKQPSVVSLSEKNLQETIKFLVMEAGCEPSYVISHPSILGLSLNRRLIPRNRILKLLKAKGHLKKELDFYNYIALSEMKFMNKFIFPYQKKMPKLLDVYVSASAEKVLS
ncbi:transcription termination factor MTERF15, mitochondrial-like [Phalaenopsis equestris]|uniref:transcription termination factor MTERF15, mitochondrial-like n=1 Tax=Phalaenopsis equestris TaxID=78828 RepID=UPI0009E454AB|nr:transcription termination factor MTERF15, mitochondrial-like [Phalaenopsis equestris]XP_020575596.1 transcription termination factor MTERF15, mitochondrial-like [Phalaenopsis equestris]XP_020575597.1 transcription termination factor MTERF15, mitochondrial-like [Phalaenopsis equestris]XP_020575598.1 transcription termination factor MTERF15, mitochondrial-like [Phalaenopsis equestris]